MNFKALFGFGKVKASLVLKETAEEKARFESRMVEYERIEKLRTDHPISATLDRLVASEVALIDPSSTHVPRYSQSNEEAIRLVEWLSREEYISTTIRIHADGAEVTMYAGDCNCPYRKEYDKRDGHGVSSLDEVEGDTVAHAICLAALDLVPKIYAARKTSKVYPKHGQVTVA